MADAPELATWAEFFGLPVPQQPAEPEQERKRGVFGRLREKLTAPRQAISPQLAGIYAPKLWTKTLGRIWKRR